MKCVEQLREDLEKIGATLDDGAGYTLNCDAPGGYVWRANGCTSIAIHHATNSQSWTAKAIMEDGLPRLKMGLEKVKDLATIAAIRFEIDDDKWGADSDAPEKIMWPSKQK